MNPRKPNISPALLLGLAALLVLGCLMAALGVSFARYRTEEKDGIQFQPAPNARVYLGYVADNVFIYRENIWVETDSGLSLSFAISNGQTKTDSASVDQQAVVRLIASLGAYQENSENPIYLTVNGQKYSAEAKRIESGSKLFKQFGDGWVFRFVDAEGNEYKWDLPGGDFSCIEMQLDVPVSNACLLQLQVIDIN